jgi:predicted nucleic acid-binding protein
LLDTNVVYETIKPRPDKAVLAWIASQSSELTAISIVTQAELWAGVLSTADDRRRRQLMEWFDQTIIGWLGNRTLPLTMHILTDWIQIGDALAGKGMTRGPADLLIASTARAHDLIIVSHNVRDFTGTGTTVYDPWTGETHRMEMG